MKIGLRFSNFALYGLVTVLATGWSFAGPTPRATVRGRLVHKNGTPAAGILVTVSNQQSARSAPAHTGVKGMYYLPNITPGKDYLEIWINPGGKPLIYQVDVVAPSTDLPQITVP
jgi:hypothetical protein